MAVSSVRVTRAGFWRSLCKQFARLQRPTALLECDRIVITHMSEEMLAHLDEADIDATTDGAVIAL